MSQGKPLIDAPLSYCKETGLIFWTEPQLGGSGRRPMDRPAGCITNAGYIYIKHKRKRYAAHRLAFMLSGIDPSGMLVDHINGEKTDNRLENLRLVSNRENLQNMKRHREGKLVGATFHKRSQKWRSQIWIGKKQVLIGVFDTELEAHLAYVNSLGMTGK